MLVLACFGAVVRQNLMAVILFAFGAVGSVNLVVVVSLLSAT
jgi:hypothetical protein